jgi:hypothetical protein
VALELQIITSHEFVRLGAHGELDWSKSLQVLSTLVTTFLERRIDLAIVDLRDAKTSLSDEQIEELVSVMDQVGLQDHHRVAILHRPRPNPKSAVFADAARDFGFDVASFDNFERAVEWLSAPQGEDPDFDREIYQGPKDKGKPDPSPPPPTDGGSRPVL